MKKRYEEKGEESMLSLSDSPLALPGIGPAKAKAFSKLGITDIRSLLFHIPRGYEDRSRIETLADARGGAPSCFLLTVGSEPRSVRLPSRMTLTKFRAFDASGSVEVVFFNQPFLRDTFSVGEEFRFIGKLTPQGRSYQLVSPKFEKYDPLDPPPDICPIYSLSLGISAGVLRKAIDTALSEALPHLKDYLPEDIRRKYGFPTLSSALRALHKPLDFASVKAASKRLAFDEFFMFSLGVSLSKQKQISLSVTPFAPPKESDFFSLFPYEPTAAQKRVCEEMLSDMSYGKVMNRILVGDVGCGKTLCAAFAVFTALSSGKQAAFMAPTEILARQHFNDLSPIFAQLGFKTALLIGSSTAKEKREAYEALALGNVDLVIGTHALLSEKIRFARLGLTVTDEQHRFGVQQRAILREKCPDAHMLVMSATPIPRTLALVLYGDLDISRIDEMPKGRKQVATYVVNESYRARLNAFIEKQVSLGGQVYVVCPAIEKAEEETQTEEGEIAYSLFKQSSRPPKDALTVTEDIRLACPSLRVAYLHGKMKTAEKDAVMATFAQGNTDVLVSTTVIEVGVNVPNATLMIVEDADRFGLAQLHQLRGRVGRGKKESFCVLVSNASGETAKARLETMKTTYDGFRVAEEDLKQRGPGDFIAASNSDTIRQSGGLSFRFASLCDDADLLSAAADEARALLRLSGEEKEKYLKEEAALFEEVNRLFKESSANIS